MITSGPSGVTGCDPDDGVGEIDYKIRQEITSAAGREPRRDPPGDRRAGGRSAPRGDRDGDPETAGGDAGPAATGGFTVDVADSIDAVDARAWDAAVEAHRLPAFYARPFLAAYERHRLTAIETCVYLTVRRRGSGPDEAPAAVVPAYLQRSPDPLGCLTPAYPPAAGRPALLGHVWHCYDTRVVGGSAPDPELAAFVVDALRECARDLGVGWCGFVNLDRDGASATALAEAGLPLRDIVVRYNAGVAGVTKLEHFLVRSARPRAAHNLRRQLRRSIDHGVVSTALLPHEADLPAVAALCRLSSSKHGSHEYYPRDRFEEFVTSLGDTARVIEVRQGGELISTGVCLLDRWRLHCWAGGALPQADGPFSPYYVMFAASLALTLDLGRAVFEGGRGNGEVKTRHGLVARPLVACLARA